MNPDELSWGVAIVATLLAVATVLVLLHGVRKGHLDRMHRSVILGLSFVAIVLIYFQLWHVM